jgi:hypothetical protein
MRKIFVIGTAAVTVFAVSVINSPRADAMPIGSPGGFNAAIREANPVQDVGYYGYYWSDGYYPPYAYYRYVCRAWWKGCEWETGHYWNYWPNRSYYGPYGYRW